MVEHVGPKVSVEDGLKYNTDHAGTKKPEDWDLCTQD
jgi:hypothetical protein